MNVKLYTAKCDEKWVVMTVVSITVISNIKLLLAIVSVGHWPSGLGMLTDVRALQASQSDCFDRDKTVGALTSHLWPDLWHVTTFSNFWLGFYFPKFKSSLALESELAEARPVRSDNLVIKSKCFENIWLTERTKPDWLSQILPADNVLYFLPCGKLPRRCQMSEPAHHH